MRHSHHFGQFGGGGVAYLLRHCTFVNSHLADRLSTIHGADQIIVMKQGRIDQVGKFQELTQQPGLFASMMAKQQA